VGLRLRHPRGRAVGGVQHGFSRGGVRRRHGLALELAAHCRRRPACELSFLPNKFTAERAEAIGLVARLWDDTVFRDEVAALAASLAARSPMADGTHPL